MPSRQRRLSLVLGALALLAGCAKNPTAVSATGTVGKAIGSANTQMTNLIGGPLIPDTTLQLGSATPAIPLEKIVYWGVWIGAAWLILDPLSPNWEIEEASLPEGHVHFKLAMKRYYSGGAGEARQTLDRRAKEWMRVGAYSGYEIVEYSESLDSSVLGSKRTAEGVIRLIGKKG